MGLHGARVCGAESRWRAGAVCVSDRTSCCAPQSPGTDAADSAQTHLRQSRRTTGQTHTTVQALLPYMPQYTHLTAYFALVQLCHVIHTTQSALYM